MSSSRGGIGSTLTSGIQDIAAILPLLGRAMFGPSQLSTYSGLSLRGIDTYVDLRKSGGGQGGIQDIGRLLLIREY